MALEFGLLSGLAAKVPWEQYGNDQQQMYHNQVQAKAMQAKNAQLFADDFDYKSPMNAYDKGRTNDYVRKNMLDTGTFIRNTPDWETNIGARIKMNQFSHDRKDNEPLNTGTASDAAYMEMKKFYDNPKNEGYRNSPEMLKQYHDWGNYSDPNKHAQWVQDNGGKDGAFTFTPPEEWKLSDAVEKYYSKLKPESRVLKGKEAAGLGYAAMKDEVSDNNLRQTAKMMLSDPSEGFHIQSAWKSLPDSDKSFYHNDPEEWLSKVGKPYTPSKLEKGWDPYKGGNGSSAAKGVDYFSRDVDSKNPEDITISTPGANILAGFITDPDTKQNFYVPSESEPLKILKPDGSLAEIKDYTGQPLESMAMKQYKSIGGVPYQLIKSFVPFTPNLTLGKNPLLSTKDGDEVDSDSSPSDYKIPTENAGVLSIRKGKREKDPDMLGISHWIPVVKSEQIRDEYNKLTGGVSDENKVASKRDSPKNPANANVKPITQNAYNSLPRGAKFMWTDGKIYTKQ